MFLEEVRAKVDSELSREYVSTSLSWGESLLTGSAFDYYDRRDRLGC